MPARSAVVLALALATGLAGCGRPFALLPGGTLDDGAVDDSCG